METSYSSQTLDHLGLVAGMCRDLGISSYLDQYCGSDSADQHVSTGKAVEAMILNGLGFVNKRLYLVSHFFADKPVSKLLGEGIEAAHLNDDRLGRALDQLYSSGLTSLFAGLSAQAISRLGLEVGPGHLDTTSLSMHGRYNSESDSVEELHITQGYSKDHRPDLAQVTLQLICSHLHGIPLHMEVLDGNSSDSVSFRQTIESFGKTLQEVNGLQTIIADSKLYCEETLKVLADSELHWISRVPSTLQWAREIIESIQLPEFSAIGRVGYQAVRYNCSYAGVDQDWVVYYSEAARQRESKTITKQADREIRTLAKQLKKLKAQSFHCQADAQQALADFSQSLKLVKLTEEQIIVHKQFKRRGRPKADDSPQISYRITAEILPDTAKIERRIFEKSLFILASDLPYTTAEAQAELLDQYKAQGSVERSFRFIKDPRVGAASIYLQRPERVASLLFVMTCCLLVYSALECKIRSGLAQQDQYVSDQKGKPTQHPTARWIFELFIGIHLLNIGEKQSLVLNLKPDHTTIINLLNYADFYT